MADNITARVLKKADGLICGFDIEDHGDPIVCSAVSVLTFNTVNSIEAFIGTAPYVEMDESGKLYFTVEDYKDEKTQLLLKSLELGLKSIEMEYNEDIIVFDCEV